MMRQAIHRSAAPRSFAAAFRENAKIAFSAGQSGASDDRRGKRSPLIGGKLGAKKGTRLLTRRRLVLPVGCNAVTGAGATLPAPVAVLAIPADSNRRVGVAVLAVGPFCEPTASRFGAWRVVDALLFGRAARFKVLGVRAQSVTAAVKQLLAFPKWPDGRLPNVAVDKLGFAVQSDGAVSLTVNGAGPLPATVHGDFKAIGKF